MSKGRAALVELAEHYPQLYVAPADNEETLAAYRLACTRGVAPEGANLDHFVTSEEDELRAIDTPAGDVETIFLKVRADFETLLQVIGHKCSPVDIAPTIGAWPTGVRSGRPVWHISQAGATTGALSLRASPSSPGRFVASSS